MTWSAHAVLYRSYLNEVIAFQSQYAQSNRHYFFFSLHKTTIISEVHMRRVCALKQDHKRR